MSTLVIVVTVLGGLAAQAALLMRYLDARLSAVTTRLDLIDRRLDRIESRLDRLEGLFERVARLEGPRS
jgi:hypothetical protein